jgi:hypothetical protein
MNMKLSIVGIYAPNDDASVQDKEQYLELLVTLLTKLRGYERTHRNEA